MVFKTYKYGSYKKDIVKLLHKRIDTKKKIRYCNEKIEQYKRKVEDIESQIKHLESLSI